MGYVLTSHNCTELETSTPVSVLNHVYLLKSTSIPTPNPDDGDLLTLTAVLLLIILPLVCIGGCGAWLYFCCCRRSKAKQTTIIQMTGPQIPSTGYPPNSKVDSASHVSTINISTFPALGNYMPTVSSAADNQSVRSAPPPYPIPAPTPNQIPSVPSQRVQDNSVTRWLDKNSVQTSKVPRIEAKARSEVAGPPASVYSISEAQYSGYR